MKHVLVLGVLLAGCSDAASEPRTSVTVSATSTRIERFTSSCTAADSSALLAVGQCGVYSDVPTHTAGCEITTTSMPGNLFGTDLDVDGELVTLPVAPPTPTFVAVPGQLLAWSVAVPTQVSAGHISIGGFPCRVAAGVTQLDEPLPSNYGWAFVSTEVETLHGAIIVRAIDEVISYPNQ